MSLKSDNKSTRNGQVILNDEKKRSSENKSNFKKIIEKKSQKEDGKKEKKINWEEEKDVIESYFRQRHSMISERKHNKIIEEKAEKYIDLEEYKTFFLKYQTKNYLPQMLIKLHLNMDFTMALKNLRMMIARQQNCWVFSLPQ